MEQTGKEEVKVGVEAVENPFVKQWEELKTRVKDLSVIALDNNQTMKDFDKLLSDQIANLNGVIGLLNAQQAQIAALSDTLMAVLELSYAKKKITKTNMQDKIVEFSVETSKDSISKAVKAETIKSVDEITEDSIVVYKTNEIPYAYMNSKEIPNSLGKKIGDRVTIKYLNEKQEIVDAEAEIIELYNAIVK